jgi:para-aminobenzoate synthetase/4-amino-4-deoxychorismate lyase
VLVRDAANGRWLLFSHPREVVSTISLAEVVPALRQVEDAVALRGFYAVGFVSYEAAPAFDPALTAHDCGGFPPLWFGLYDHAQEVDLPAPAAGPRAVPARSAQEYAPMPGEPARPGESGAAASRDGSRLGEIDWQASVGFAEFEANVKRIKELIRSGDTYQVNYTYRLGALLATDPWEFFLHLVAAQAPPYGAFVDTGEWVIASASPELFFQLAGDRIFCRPMKGTAARGLTQVDDLAQAEALRASEKERAENVMIVDMVRNDLGRVAEPGSVTVPRLFTVEKYPTVWQMTSTIEARTKTGLCDMFRALFPPASITGAPKVRTMEIISQLEPSPRRIYTGAIGFVAPGRRAQFNVAIRTLLLDRKTGRAEYSMGGGITWGSQPEAEWQECRDKAKILTARVPAFSLLETMLWTAEEGYFLLARHLERLKQSALYFGFSVDLPAVRRELEHLSVELAHTRQKVRLLVTREGRVTLEADSLPAGDCAPQRITVASGPVNSSNPFLYHKTTNRGLYEAARAACPGYDDVLLFNEKGEATESTIANLAVEIEGRLYTPPVRCGLLPGTLRADLIEQRTLLERPMTVREVLQSPRVLFLNSVRGMYRVQVVAVPENNTHRSMFPVG